jgi:hypothetical protein
MAKLLKIVGRTLGISLEWILILIIAFAYAIRLSPVQTYLAQQATAYLSKELNTKIHIDKVSILFIDEVALDGVFILDQQEDTLASIKTIYLSLDDWSLEKNYFKLGKAELDEGIIHINREKNNGDYNYFFISDYFASGKTSTGKKQPKITLNSLALTNIHVKYDDFRKTYNTYGIDYDHLDLRNVSLSASNFSSENGVIKATINSLTAKEKCGFYLKAFRSEITVSEKGLQFDKVEIKTPLSTIHAPKIHLLMNEREDLETFEDSVSFDAILAKSIVSMKDISVFATALEGMDQMVELSGKVTKKVKDLKIENLDLKTGKNTVIKGTFNLPDFRDLKGAFFSEKVDYAFISLSDLKKIKMPIDASYDFLSFDKYLERLGYFQLYDVRLDGFYSEFVIASDKVKTQLGTVRLNNGMMFTENPVNHSYLFKESSVSEYDVKVEEFQLGKFLDNSTFGLVDGTFHLSGEAFSLADIHFTSLKGNINRFDYMDYTYNGIHIKEGSFIDNVFIAQIDIKDDNINLLYDGFIDFNGNQHMDFTINLSDAILYNLGFTKVDSTVLNSKFHVNLFGKEANGMKGQITMDGLVYQEGNRFIDVPSLVIDMKRGVKQDEFTVNSAELGTLSLVGKIDFNTLIDDFTAQFDKVFPSIIETKKSIKKKKTAPSYFDYSISTKNLNGFLSIFVPNLKIEPKTTLKGKYDGRTEDFTMSLISPKINYLDMQFNDVNVQQALTSKSMIADYRVGKFMYNDSIHLDQVHFVSNGKQNALNSELTWNPGTLNESDIIWDTYIIDNKTLSFTLKPSYFSINDQRWEIENQSDLTVAFEEIHVSKFKLERNKQYITLDGCLSRNDADKLNFQINDLNLVDISHFIGSAVQMEGIVNGWGYLSNPYTNLNYIGDAAIQGLYLNKQEVGDVFVQTEWNRASESIGMMGDLMYRGNQTFKFDGSYFTEREKENLDFNLVFDQTDIQFTNAFLEPNVINNIKGLIDGRIKVTGSPDKPLLKGDVELMGGNAKIELLGVNIGFNGKISADEYGFYMDNMPVIDEEGNEGALIGSVYHNNFEDWNFDLQFDLEGQNTAYSTSTTYKPYSSLDKFMVLNTQYKEGDYYYGKAYVTGTANIFGYTDNLEITVDMQSKKGTTVNFPMYGSSELSDEESFISFKSKGQTDVPETPKIDFTGVDLNMNFRVTPEAKLKIIFNDQTGDEISATGSGDIGMKLNTLGDLTMDGTFKVKNGVYNFAMGIIKQPFIIEEGGTIAWTGDPYNANIDIRTYYEINTSLATISPDQLQGSSSAANQKIQCYLGLTESLLKPTIGFDIKAPKADETGKALIARITSDKDELNRQFFSLMLLKRFQPLKGAAADGGSAAADLVSNQINSILAQVSKEYKLNVDLEADNITGENSLAIGLSKGFLDDRLVFTGSFGVENNAVANQQTQSALIGDVSLEYKLNEAGTFRVNVFNESNDYSIIQDKNLGLFTQGAGLHYQESFDNFDNFKLAQYFFDIFRKKANKKYPIKRKKRQTPVPSIEDKTQYFLLPKEKTIFERIFS